MSRPRRVRGAGSALTSFLLLLAACGTSAPSATTPPTPEPTATPTAEPTPRPDPAALIFAECADAPEPEGEPVALAMSASSSGFDTRLLEGPRHCEPFTITLTNNDTVAAHNVGVFPADQVGVALFLGDTFKGPRTVTYEIPALPAGEYLFVCSPHRESMRGTLVVSPPT